MAGRPHSAEHRAKLSEIQRRRHAEDPDLRVRMAAATKATYAANPALGQAVSARLRGRPATEKQLKALATNHGRKGVVRSPEVRARIAAGIRKLRAEQPVSAETRAKQAALMRARMASGELDHRGKKRSPEACANISRGRQEGMERRRKEREAALEIERGRTRAAEAAAAFRARHGLPAR